LQRGPEPAGFEGVTWEIKGGIEDMLSQSRRRQLVFTAATAFPERLNRLLRLRAEQAGAAHEDGVRLIDRAIYSSYCDAVDLEIADEAASCYRFATTANSRPG
jgi:hypothetical protein